MSVLRSLTVAGHGFCEERGVNAIVNMVRRVAPVVEVERIFCLLVCTVLFVKIKRSSSHILCAVVDGFEAREDDESFRMLKNGCPFAAKKNMCLSIAIDGRSTTSVKH